MSPEHPRQIGVFGGSFDPPHTAHVLVASYALAVLPIETLLVIPVFKHPFAKDLSPFAHRLRMCELAFQDLRRCEVSRIEEDLGGTSYTVRTLERLTALHPSARLRLIVGTDVASKSDEWADWPRVVELAPPLLVGRAGFEGTGETTLTFPRLSSTELRECLRHNEDVGDRVPSHVADYARQHRLYDDSP